MILQSLVDLYGALVEKGDIFRPGWGLSKVSFALYLNDAGEITECVSLKSDPQNGKKKVLLPQNMTVPAPVKRAVDVTSNFLCDNSAYILGIDSKGKPKRTQECFAACKALHEEILSDVNSHAARAILAFYKTWQPENAANCEALKDNFEEILSGANLVFRYDGEYAQNDPQIAAAWQRHYMSVGDKEQGMCLVTGEKAPIARLHPAIKGVKDAQSSGAALVSFNAPAFCSYEREQGMNAQTSEYAAFAYGAALNYLIADREHTSYIGDTLVLCWAKKAETEYQDAFCACLYGDDIKYSEGDLHDMMKSISSGKPVSYDEKLLDPDMEFYVLGIAPNAARLSVRFFLRNSFGNIVRNVNEHYKRLEIEKPSFATKELTIWRLLNETVNSNSKDKKAAPQLAGDLLRAVLNDTLYPATLLNGIVLRIRAEHDISYGKAAAIKAYYLKNKNIEVPEEVLTVSLNKESTNTAYVLGRLFSILENIQEAANPGINATIKDKYFNSAASTPAVVFPTLVNLSQKHLKKLEDGRRRWFEIQLGEIMNILDEGYPTVMSLPQQGSFQLGYYHQTQARYLSKKD